MIYNFHIPHNSDCVLYSSALKLQSLKASMCNTLINGDDSHPVEDDSRGDTICSQDFMKKPHNDHG